MKDTSSMSHAKKACALDAAREVQSGMRVGLGTGSTTAFVIEELGRRAREEGLEISCVATSFQSQELALHYGLNLRPLSSVAELDISIDGADEVDPQLNLIKGGGAAHTREKLVHAMSRRFLVVIDNSKLVDQLGTKFAVPIEVIPESIGFVRRRLLELGAASVDLRQGKAKDGPVVTDNGNFCFDARFTITDPTGLEAAINNIPGVLENGIFAPPVVKVSRVYIGEESGVRLLEAKS